MALFTFGSAFLSLLSSLRQNGSCLQPINKFILSFNPAFMLGCLAFTQTAVISQDYYETIMNSVLLLSFVIYFIWSASKSSMLSPSLPAVIDASELFALAGMFSSTLVVSDKNSFGIFASLTYIGLTIFALYRKNLIITILLPLYVLLVMKTVLNELDGINKESLGVFFLILMVEPLSSVFTSPDTALKSWEPVLGKF